MDYLNIQPRMFVCYKQLHIAIYVWNDEVFNFFTFKSATACVKLQLGIRTKAKLRSACALAQSFLLILSILSTFYLKMLLISSISYSFWYMEAITHLHGFFLIWLYCYTSGNFQLSFWETHPEKG